MDSGTKDRRPVIIGAGQFVHRPEDPAEALRPVDLIESAVRRAEEDTGIPGLAKQIDNLCLVNILCEPEGDHLSEVARRIGADPKNTAYTWIGASAPQWFVNRTAESLFDGRSRLTLICGGEAFYSLRLKADAKFKAQDIGSGKLGVPSKRPDMVGDLRNPITSLELNYGLIQPIHIYPLFENALRHHEGLSIEEHQKELGEFCAGFSAIAAKNPYAWFPYPRTSDEITRLSGDNRMISFPYTKLMCSIMTVDQASALFLTDEKTAADIGVPREKWVYLLGSGDASDIWHVSERVNLYSSPSAKTASGKAMEQAGVTLEQVDYLDFYSCFPVATRMTRNMLGLAKDDPRPLTVTGGMPYFGGPGNNYSMHAISRMVELLRQDPERIGMVQALSWYISKHSVGLYSGRPGARPWKPLPPESYQAELDRIEGPPLVKEASGAAEVETYTVFHDRKGQPSSGVIVGRLGDGSRFLARPEEDKDLLRAMTRQEFIGMQGRVSLKDNLNVMRF